MKSTKADNALVAACLKGKSSAQRALYDKFVQAMYNTVYRYTFNHHDTQDILQIGFTKVFRHLKKFDPRKGDLLSWIRKIHIHCALDFLQQKKVQFEEISELSTLTAVYAVEVEELDTDYILAFIEQLTPRDRIIFNMYQIEGYSHEEIAEALSININSSRVYLARAKKILRDKIMAYQGRISLVQ
jgi:RNA polymerase sigma factor (sigma-70 family)